MSKDNEKAAPAVVDVRHAVVEEPLLTPEEHARNEKQFIGEAPRFAQLPGQSATIVQYTWQHNAAAARHGWEAHAHHEGAPMRMTAKAYRNALRAAANPDARGDYAPCDAALSPHCPHQRKG